MIFNYSSPQNQGKRGYMIKITFFNQLPLFQLYSFLTNISPLGLKGPFSLNAPTPTEEHPGPVEENQEHSEIKRRPLSLFFPSSSYSSCFTLQEGALLTFIYVGGNHSHSKPKKVVAFVFFFILRLYCFCTQEI